MRVRFPSALHGWGKNRFPHLAQQGSERGLWGWAGQGEIMPKLEGFHFKGCLLAGAKGKASLGLMLQAFRLQIFQQALSAGLSFRFSVSVRGSPSLLLGAVRRLNLSVIL